MIKKVLFIFLLLSLVLVIIPLFNIVNAEYTFACGVYSVDYINDQGGFDNIACFNDYSSAKNKMKENKDYVVRHINAYSPTKIVAMNSGLVYSYPRGSSSTMNLYQDYNDKANKTTTYVTRRYEMTYIDTEYMSEKKGYEGQGYTKVILNGFEGYADTEYCDFVPSKFIDNKLPIYVGGSYGGNSIDTEAVIFEPNYYILNNNDNYVDLEFHYHLSHPKSNTDKNAQEYTLRIDNGSNYTFMNLGIKYYSDDGINFYSDYTKTNKVGTCYNYYQFLPMRTKTSISGSTMDNFIKYMRSDYNVSKMYGKGNSFTSLGDEYGANGALIFALSCQESAYGTSGYAVNRNNLFGWQAFDDSPNDASYFSDVDVAIKEHMGRNLRRYADVNDYRYNGTYVGSKGSGFNLKYASDPYWGIKIASIYYNLDKYANNKNGKLTDHNKYDLGLINTFSAKIYKDSNAKEVLFTSEYNSSRQIDNIVVVLEDIGDYYKIQCPNPIKDNQMISNVDGVYAYSWSKSIAYIKKSDISLITNNNAIVINNVEFNHNLICVVDELHMEDGVISINGVGALSNYNYFNEEDVKHVINVYDLNTNELIDSIGCEHLDTSWYVINDGYSYKWAGFKALIDTKKYPLSTYVFKLEITYNEQSKEVTLNSSNKDFAMYKNEIGDTFYKLSTNDIYNYRLELDVMNNGLAYIDLKKPGRLSSLVTIDSIEYVNDDVVFKGVGMMYYLNYNNDINMHKMYLLKDDKVIELDTKTIKSDFDYKSFYKSSYDMSYICYEASIDLNKLDGDYRIVLEVGNGEYKDIVTLNNRFNNPHLTLNNDKFEVTYAINSNNRSELIMSVNNKSEVNG